MCLHSLQLFILPGNFMPSGIRSRRAAKSGQGKRKTRARKNPSKSAPPAGNAIVAANWNPKETLAQNYTRLGLTVRVQKSAGGTEKKDTHLTHKGVKEGRIVEDENGETHIEYLSDSESEFEGFDEDTEVVKQLKESAVKGPPEPVRFSESERQYLHALINKHADDYEAMRWDRKLNKFQYSAGELRRRIKNLKH